KSNEVGSVVAIVDIVGDTYEEAKEEGAKITILSLLNIAVWLSANLGVMNLLPIPALDGGKLLFCVIEIVRGKPVDREKEGMVHFIGMILLLLLMVFLIFNDVKNIFFAK
ncbi:MAG: site-2 protease family protein, partial [Lachnospiraceae bacterium]|nr:site-2 protease family protein [Lachnospiraceae bacterium]